MITVPYVLFLVFTIAIVICVIIQTVVIIGLVLTVKKSVAGIGRLVNDVDAKAMPLISQARTIVEDLSPKVRVITANLVDISTTVKDQTRHVNSTVGEVVDKTRHQADRVDEMVSAILDGVTHASATIQAGVAKPVRQVSGIVAGLRAGLETLLQKKAKPTRTYTNGTAAEESKTHFVETPIL